MQNSAPASLKALHQVILMIAVDFDAFCKEHDIAYFMMGGTALGAARHKGFIPWDDDFDVFMDHVNYAKFVELAPRFMPSEKYYVQIGDTQEWPLHFSKLRLNGSHYSEADNVGNSMHEGIFIDIICLHSAFKTDWLRWCQYVAGKALSAGALAQRGYKTRSKKKRLAMKVAKHSVRGPAKWALQKIVRGTHSKNSQMVGHFFGRAPFRATSFPREWLGEGRKVAFEQAQLTAPQALEAYLAMRFGPDFMSPPSGEVRASFPSHAVDFDLGKWGNSV